jgi:hypothetical protein
MKESRSQVPFLVLAISLYLQSLAAQADSISPERSARAREALVEWYECEECEENQLEQVMNYREDVVPSLIATLNGGPGPASRELMRRGLEERYDRLLEYQRNHPEAKISAPKEKFVTQYLSNYDAQYRVRAAQALGAIGGDSAEKGLRGAMKQPYRADVRSSIERALGEAQRNRK